MVTPEEIYLLLPHIIIAASAIIIMLGIAVKRSHLFSYVFSLIAFAAAFVAVCMQGGGEASISTLFVYDPFSRFLNGLILVAAFFISIFSYPYLKAVRVVREEYYILFTLSVLGAISMVSSNHFISFVLALEVLSVSLFGLLGYLKQERVSIEAGLKYLLMAAVATSFILFGFALIYVDTGSMNLSAIGTQLAGTPSFNLLLLGGLGMVMVGLGYKMALVPFHLWTPDIYAGAPAPVSMFVATISKGAAFAFLLRLFYSIGGLENDAIWVAFAAIATASMFIGNWLALRQQNIKRLLAYSSISHLGYLMVAFLSSSEAGVGASAFYLSVYFVSMLAAFGTVVYLTNQKGEPLMVEDYRGLFWKRPALSAFFTVVMLSLAGIPLTAGFMGKFLVLTSGSGAGIVFLLIVLVVSSTIGLFYYLRVVAVMFAREGAAVETSIGDRSLLIKAVMVILFICLFWLGVYPGLVLDWISAF